jgi:hypothetical protein
MTNDNEKKFAERIDTHLAGTAQAGNDEAWETIYALRPDLAPAPNVKHEELVDALNVTAPAPVNRSMRWRAAALILSAAAAVLIFVPMPDQDPEVLVYTSAEKASKTEEVALEASTEEAPVPLKSSTGVSNQPAPDSDLRVITKTENGEAQLDATVEFGMKSEGFAGGATNVGSMGGTNSGSFEASTGARAAPVRKRTRAQPEIPIAQALAPALAPAPAPAPAPAEELIAEASEDELDLPQTRDELLATIQPPAEQGAANALQVAKEFIKRKDLLSADIAVKMGLKFGDTPSMLALKELEIWLQENIPPTP